MGTRAGRRSGLLAELVVVLTILGMLAAVAVQGLSRLKAEAVRVACEADVQATSSAAELYRVRHQRYPDAVATLRSEGYLTVTVATDHTLDYVSSGSGRAYSVTGLLTGGGVCAAAGGGV